MKLYERMDMIRYMAQSLTESIKAYEDALEKEHNKPMVGYTISREDSAECIKNSIKHMRSELMRLAKEIN